MQPKFKVQPRTILMGYGICLPAKQYWFYIGGNNSQYQQKTFQKYLIEI